MHLDLKSARDGASHNMCAIMDQPRQIKCVHADDWGLASRPWGDIGRRGLSLPGHHSLKAGRLIGGLVSMARRESWRDGRSALSRHPRECTAARRESASGEIARGIVMQVFLATPTCRERECCPIDLLRPSRRAYQATSSCANGNQLCRSVPNDFALRPSQMNFAVFRGSVLPRGPSG